jgi:hypothetical protein
MPQTPAHSSRFTLDGVDVFKKGYNAYLDAQSDANIR